MALDLMKCDAVGETEETFGYKTTPAGYLVACLCGEAGVSLGDHSALIDGATFDVDEGLLVRDSYGRTFRLSVTPTLVKDEEEATEPWRKTFRRGILPALWEMAGGRLGYVKALRAVEHYLLGDDDGTLCQGNTTEALGDSFSVRDYPGRGDRPCDGACFVGYLVWKGGLVKTKAERATINEVEEGFAQMCFLTDKHMGEPAACRWFLNWFDETPMSSVRQPLLREVMRALSACGLPC